MILRRKHYYIKYIILYAQMILLFNVLQWDNESEIQFC